MKTVDYSPSELFPILDLWDEFVWLSERSVTSGKSGQPRYYPFQLVENAGRIPEARKNITGRETVGERLLEALSKTTFSEKAATYIANAKIKEAVLLLLQKKAA